MTVPISKTPLDEAAYLVQSSTTGASSTDSMDPTDPNSIMYDPSLDPSNPAFFANITKATTTAGVDPTSDEDTDPLKAGNIVQASATDDTARSVRSVSRALTGLTSGIGKI